jgi:hypothetical protein
MGNTELTLFLAEVGWPVVVFIIGALTMHKSGMLPQQRRLDTLLKDVIRGQEEQLRLRDATIQGLQQQVDASNSAAAALSEQARNDLREKDAALEALHRALVREHQETATLRAQIADTSVKVGALTSHQRREDNGENVH